MQTEKEIELIEGCRAGDIRCQKELYDTYGPLIKGICDRYISDPQEMEDQFHDIFVFILTNFDRFDNITSLGGWLRVITINKLLDHLRKVKNHPSMPMSYMTQEFSDPRQASYDGIPMQVLQSMINELPLKNKTAFNLYVVDELEQEEIARLMGETQTNVRSLISRAKKKLREKIEKYLRDEEYHYQ